MSLKLPNDKIVYNLPEQVGVNTENIKYLAEVYKEIDSIPAQYAEIKTDYEDNIKSYFDETMKPTFTTWTNTFNGWSTQLETYLASMSSAAVGAIAGQDIAPANIAAIGNITADSIIENMNGYLWGQGNPSNVVLNKVYVGAAKNGNKLTTVICYKFTSSIANPFIHLGSMVIPASVGNKIFPVQVGSSLIVCSNKITITGNSFSDVLDELYFVSHNSATSLEFYLSTSTNLTINKEYYVRIESTFLLSDSL